MATTLLAAAAKSAAGPRSAVARAVDALPQARTNVSAPERVVSLVAGGALAALGFDGRGPSVLSSLVGGYLLYRAATGNCPAYQALGVSGSDATAPNSSIAARHGTRIDHTVVVNKPAREVYRFWRDLENLPRFMTHLIDVDTTTDGQSLWTARGPLGIRVQWEAKLIADEPGKVISWQSLDGADVDTAGSVHFTEVPGRGTEVRVALKYDPPAGKLGAAVARLFGTSPEAQIRADMERFRHIVETGEVPRDGGTRRG
ncbi:SRPBCC family protein [Gemmata sp.]|uniref:SRPBCC family protein n=1 Tax=Gemmata sp. TaxID=1914242 RepID=UPI003F729C59